MWTATYKERSEEYTTKFVVPVDECTTARNYEFKAKNVLSTTELGSLTEEDSAAVFFGLLTGAEYAGIGKALKAAETEPVAYIDSSEQYGYRLNLLESDSVSVQDTAATRAQYKDGSRHAAQTLVSEDTYSDYNSLAAGDAQQYRKVKIKVGTTAAAKVYYGYFALQKTSLAGVAFALKYSSKRNYANN